MDGLASPATIFTMVVNFVLGAGVLGLPYAIATAGIIASAVSLVVVGLLSFLTSSWLLEVGDRANALQNELSRSQQYRTVQHENGEVSVLPPASGFCRSSALNEPLLERGERKLDEYRAAYRSWRTGSHHGVRVVHQRAYEGVLLYQRGKHRELLPLQLMPASRAVGDEEEEEDVLSPSRENHILSSIHSPASTATPTAQVSRSAMTSLGGSTSSWLDKAAGADRSKPPALKKSASFSVDLAAALQALPDSFFEAAEGDEAALHQVYVAPNLTSALVPSFVGQWEEAAADVASPSSARRAQPQVSVPEQASPIVPGHGATMADALASCALASWLKPPSTPQATTDAEARARAAAEMVAGVLPALPPSVVVSSPSRATEGAVVASAVATPLAAAIAAIAPRAAAVEHEHEHEHDSSARGEDVVPDGISRRTTADEVMPRRRVTTSSLADATAPAPAAPREAKRRGRRLPDWSVPAVISALEVSQLCNLFLGWRARSLWIVSICCLHIAAMWACCAIWTTCAGAMLGGGGGGGAVETHLHLLLLLLCAAVFLPLCTLGGTAVVQPPLAVATLGTLALMCVLLVLGLFDTHGHGHGHASSGGGGHGGGGGAGWELFESDEQAVRVDDAEDDAGEAAAAAVALRAASAAPRDRDPQAAFRALVIDPAAFGPAFATFLFSFILQQSIPSLVRAAAQPATTRAAVGAAIGTCCGLYLLLGCSAALLFGAQTKPLITLNFGSFRGGAARGEPTPLWATLVSRWVMLLPLLTTTAAFPLFNNVLASNLVGLLPRSWGRLRSVRVAAALCALPPLLCTALVSDTAFLFSLCGLFGFAIVFFVPAALQLAAMRASVKRWGAAGRATPHTTLFSSSTTVGAVLAFGSAAFAFNVWLVLVKPLAARAHLI